jgi:hypothetical protein
MHKMDEFVVVIEGSSDAPTATELAERVLIKNVAWLDFSLLPSLFVWSGLQPGTSCAYWQNLKKDVNELGIRVPTFRSQHGWGEQKPDRKMARKVLYLIRQLQKQRPIRAVLLVRDTDNQPERRTGLEQARAEYENTALEIVIGMADQMREAWVLNGFIPQDEREKAILHDYREKLNFDPCLEAERLRSKSREMPERVRNVKVVVEELTGGNKEREALCWQKTDLNILRRRGINTGLTAYMEEVEQRLLPLLVSR